MRKFILSRSLTCCLFCRHVVSFWWFNTNKFEYCSITIYPCFPNTSRLRKEIVVCILVEYNVQFLWVYFELDELHFCCSCFFLEWTWQFWKIALGWWWLGCDERWWSVVTNDATMYTYYKRDNVHWHPTWAMIMVWRRLSL